MVMVKEDNLSIGGLTDETEEVIERMREKFKEVVHEPESEQRKNQAVKNLKEAILKMNEAVDCLNYADYWDDIVKEEEE